MLIYTVLVLDIMAKYFLFKKILQVDYIEVNIAARNLHTIRTSYDSKIPLELYLSVHHRINVARNIHINITY